MQHVQAQHLQVVYHVMEAASCIRVHVTAVLLGTISVLQVEYILLRIVIPVNIQAF